jgi:hypothetical protein
MGGVFISYRREDSQGEALHLSDDLKERFGIDRIFMDVTGIDPGKDFRKVIENAVTTCDVLIVMIGKKWIDALDEEGKRRLDDPTDFVRIETAAALHRDVPVIPVLVQGAGVPRPEQLPAEIEALAWRNAFELRHNRWSIDVAELVTALRKVVPSSSTISSEENKSQRWWQTVPGILTAAAGIITAVVGLLVTLHQIGLLGNKEKPAFLSPSSYNDTTKRSEATAPSSTPAKTAEPSKTELPSVASKTFNDRARPYSVTFPSGTEVTLSNGTYKILAAQVDSRNTGKLTLKLSIRLTNTGIYPLLFWNNAFRLVIDGVPRAPISSVIETVEGRSAKEGDVMFEMPDTAESLVLSVARADLSGPPANGEDTANIPIVLKKSD